MSFKDNLGKEYKIGDIATNCGTPEIITGITDARIITNRDKYGVGDLVVVQDQLIANGNSKLVDELREKYNKELQLGLVKYNKMLHGLGPRSYIIFVINAQDHTVRLKDTHDVQMVIVPASVDEKTQKGLDKAIIELCKYIKEAWSSKTETGISVIKNSKFTYTDTRTNTVLDSYKSIIACPSEFQQRIKPARVDSVYGAPASTFKTAKLVESYGLPYDSKNIVSVHMNATEFANWKLTNNIY